MWTGSAAWAASAAVASAMAVRVVRRVEVDVLTGDLGSVDVVGVGRVGRDAARVSFE
jgi:hypothetical protein